MAFRLSIFPVCRACISKKLKAGSTCCPVCGESVRSPPVSDLTLQRLVYLAVPGIYRAEQEHRRRFREHGSSSASSSGSSADSPLGAPSLTFEDMVSLSLRQVPGDERPPLLQEDTTRYLKCQAGVTVRHLLRLLRLKRGWNDEDPGNGLAGNCNRIEILYDAEAQGAEGKGTNGFPKPEVLEPAWTLLDLACIFDWKRVSDGLCFFQRLGSGMVRAFLKTFSPSGSIVE